MNDQTYFFQSSIGKKIIFKETLKNFNESVKNFDWTDNKIYKPALNIDISTTFDESNKINENEISLGKLIFYKIRIENQLKKNIKFSNFLHLKNFIISSYTKNDQESLKNLHILINLLKEKGNLEEDEKKFLLEINCLNKDSYLYKDMLKIILKHKNCILKQLPYQIIEGKEYDYLIKFIENKEKKEFKPFSIIPSKNDDNLDNFLFKDSSHDFNLLNFQERNSFTNEIQNQNYIMSILINELKDLINDHNISDDNCIDLLIKNSNSAKEAASQYFINKYKSKILNVIYVKPCGEEKKITFDLNADSGDIFTPLYNLCPELENPKLFFFGNEFIIDFNKIKLIGAINLAQNCRLCIKK